MRRTFKANGMSFRLFGSWWLLLCAVTVLCLLPIDGVGAADNSSGVVSSGNNQASSDGGETDDESPVEKGMRPFFDMVQGFLGVVQPKRLPEESWINLSQIIKDGTLQEDEISDWKNWVLYLVGFVVCAAVGLLFIVVMPITGLVFCCCRCAGKCGGKPKPQDSKHASCKRTTFCTLLLILNTVALAGVVCAFLSNQLLYDKMRNKDDQGPTGRIVNSADLINGFVNDTIDDVSKAVLDPFLAAKDGIVTDITDSAAKAVNDVLDTLNASALLRQSKDLADDVSATLGHLVTMADDLDKLDNMGTELGENLTAIKMELDTLCNGLNCNGIETNQLATSANFSGLDRLSSEISKVNSSVNLDEYVQQAEQTIDSAKNNATSTVNSSISESATEIDKVEKSIRDAVDELTTKLQKEVTSEVEKFRNTVRDSQDDITKYSQYAWYVGLGVSCVLLLVVALYYIGILYGLCGERPGFGAQCCNTGTGANFLMAGVGFTFILGWLIMLVCIITFMVGGPFYTEVCRYFDGHKPKDLQPYSDALMEFVDLQNALYKGQDVDISLVTVLEGCQNNSAIYSVLKLEYMVNLTQQLDLTEVQRELDKLKTESLDIPTIDILTPEMEDSLDNFNNSGVDNINYTAYDAELNKNMTVGNLRELAVQLTNLATTSSSQPQQQQHLLNISARLEQLQTDVVVPMQTKEQSLKDSLDWLRSNPGIKQSTDNLKSSLRQAEDNFNANKNDLVNQSMVVLVDRVLGTVQNLVNTSLQAVKTDVGKCHAVYESFYSASDSLCVVALEPLNGLWFSIGWCLFFFVPSLIFAVKLAGLYRREHEERDFDDPNYHLYSEGGKQDIPLTSRQQSMGGRDPVPSAAPDRQPRGGIANDAYQADTNMGPSDYPNYKGGNVNSGYQGDGYRQPPPYGAQSPPYGHHGEPLPPGYATAACAEERLRPTAPSQPSTTSSALLSGFPNSSAPFHAVPSAPSADDF